MNAATLQWLTDTLWPDGDTAGGNQVYLLLDGARDPLIAHLVRSGSLEYCCLFSGTLDPALSTAAPWLVHLEANSPTTQRLLTRGWGHSWGIFTIAPAHVTLAQQRLHLKKLLRVQTAGRVLGFRYHDPRVLNVYLPTCTEDEWRTVLGPLTSLCAETGDGAGLRVFSRDDYGRCPLIGTVNVSGGR